MEAAMPERQWMWALYIEDRHAKSLQDLLLTFRCYTLRRRQVPPPHVIVAVAFFVRYPVCVTH